MPGALHFLDEMSRSQIANWLLEALRGNAHVPREYQNQPVAGAISAAAPDLGTIARADLHAAALHLVSGLQTGRHPNSYVASLLRLVTDLDLRDAIPVLRKIASTIPALKDRLGWEGCCEILFSLLNLRDLQDESFWRQVWKYNKRCFSPVTLAALFDLDSDSALTFLPELPNSAELGDLVALTLDHAADSYQGNERTRFRQSAAAVAPKCKSHIRNAIVTLLAETAPPSLTSTRNLDRLHAALGPLPENFPRTPAKLCEAAA
jgi:hypothetical protein